MQSLSLRLSLFPGLKERQTHLTNRLKYGRNNLIPRGRRHLGAACGARYGSPKCQPSPPPGNRTGRLSDRRGLAFPWGRNA